MLIDVKTLLGEGPLWDVDEQRLYFIDSFRLQHLPLHLRRARGARLGRPREDRLDGAAPSGRRGVSLANGFHFLDFKSGFAG